MPLSKDGQKRKIVVYVSAIAIIGGLLFATYCAVKNTGRSSDNRPQAGNRGFFKDIPEPQSSNGAAAIQQQQTGIRSLIEGLIVNPVRPTVLDALKVEVQIRVPKEGKPSYEYQWQLNGKPVEGVNGNVFPAGLAKKNDRVTITVIPSVDGVAYKEFNYNITKNIYNAAPSLLLTTERRKTGDIIELQLIGSDPDGDKITYALEEPFLEGMSIDKMTGKIIWKPTKIGVGVYRFGASATDSDGSKTTKTLEFSLDVK